MAEINERRCACGGHLRPRERTCLPCKRARTTEMRERRRANPITSSVRKAVVHRDGKLCRHCGRIVRFRRDRRDFAPDVLELDHLIPLIDGGDSREANVVVACLPCNRGRRNRVTDRLAAQPKSDEEGLTQ